MRKHIGWIALDIDGTITDETHHAPAQVIHFLHLLEKRGWELIFITGRTYSFGYRVVKEFDFPFYLAVQNGADILYMPSKERVARHYLDDKAIPILDAAYRGEKEDFLIYAGYEHGDFCYYRPDRFSPAYIEHLHKIMALSPERWKPVQNFDFEKGISFPLAKCLGSKEAMQRVTSLLETHPNLSATMIRDPLGEGIYLILVTAKQATKGNALQIIKQVIGDGGPVIAAGDDLNDISMLQIADVKIVMSSAPPEMHPMATILAEHGEQHGIIEALTKATEMGFLSK
ncbi:MAG: HAD family hydrolase [Rhabdochlamydiaceae bacterium]|jgi:hydroxymethylpyrimidine pyrophosphatase-like HAD family hydrolase